jgi:glycosyltransferase involved in cell wall biosynthesis
MRSFMPELLKVVIDGIIYRLQSTGGISRLFSEILPRICELDESVEMTIFTSGLLGQQPPGHPHILHRRIPDISNVLRVFAQWQSVRNRIEKIGFKRWIGDGKDKIWHSTYYTMPRSWEGPQVVTVADMIYERFPDLFSGPGSDQFREQQKRCAKTADVVLCISEATKKDVEEIYHVDPHRLHVVHLACSEIFRPLIESDFHRSGQAVRQPFFLYVGSRAHYKNFSWFINAYSRWNDKKEVRLLVVGPKWTKEEYKELNELGIEDRVDIVSDAQDETLCSLYNQAAAFIYPSLYEGFGIPLLEALACGCPVIASRIPTSVEVAGQCPIYFELDQEDSIITAFDTALTEGPNCHRTREGLERAKEFSWDKTARGTLDVYRSLS